MSSPIRVMIAEPDEDALGILRRVIARDRRFEPVGAATTGQQVLEELETLEPDVLFLALEIGDPSGIDVLTRIGEGSREVDVVVTSRSAESRMTMRALAGGALEFVSRASGRSEGSTYEERLDLALRNLAVSVAKRRQSRPVERVESVPVETSSLADAFDLVLIGISTGGPAALEVVLREIAGIRLPPVVIVQHMGRAFTSQLAAMLSRNAGRPVVEAERDMALEPGSIVLAPGGFHTELCRRRPGDRRYRLGVVEDEPVNGCRPSVDVMWRSVAANFDGDVLAFLMTGMGEDGSQGLRALREKGAYCIAQDEATSVVWGMPGAAVRSGLVDEVLSLEEIAVTMRRGIQKS